MIVYVCQTYIYFYSYPNSLSNSLMSSNYYCCCSTYGPIPFHESFQGRKRHNVHRIFHTLVLSLSLKWNMISYILRWKFSLLVIHVQTLYYSVFMHILFLPPIYYFYLFLPFYYAVKFSICCAGSAVYHATVKMTVSTWNYSLSLYMYLRKSNITVRVKRLL